MKEIAKGHSKYSLENASENHQEDYREPKIDAVIKLETDSSDVRCMKGDCCKDCPGNYVGG